MFIYEQVYAAYHEISERFPVYMHREPSQYHHKGSDSVCSIYITLVY